MRGLLRAATPPPGFAALNPGYGCGYLLPQYTGFSLKNFFGTVP